VSLGPIHQALSLIAVVGDVGVLLLAGLGVLLRRWDRVLADRLILAVLAATGLAALAGVAVALQSRPPSDPLHLVYGIAAILVLPIARYLGRSGSDRRRAGWLAVGSLVLLALYARLWMTAG
jgi:Kef-type K+ transport system membrane component KefB